jgi:peptidoglycan LD-endopeptidase CwlK
LPEFTSERSQQVRRELTSSLGAVVDSAIQHIDFQLIDGARTLQRQQALYRSGMSTLDGANKRSKHQISKLQPKARAFDFLPYPLPDNDWDNRPLFSIYAGFFIGIGWTKGIELTWGGDWDGDFLWRDQTFHDFPHLEEKYG